jgi:hypothetical protein
MNSSEDQIEDHTELQIPIIPFIPSKTIPLCASAVNGSVSALREKGGIDVRRSRRA